MFRAGFLPPLYAHFGALFLWLYEDEALWWGRRGVGDAEVLLCGTGFEDVFDEGVCGVDGAISGVGVVAGRGVRIMGEQAAVCVVKGDGERCVGVIHPKARRLRVIVEEKHALPRVKVEAVHEAACFVGIGLHDGDVPAAVLFVKELRGTDVWVNK